MRIILALIRLIIIRKFKYTIFIMLRSCSEGMMTGYSSRTYKYFVSPLKSGLMGFSFFFSILMFTKLFGYVFKLNLTFDVDIKDVVISTLGFGLLFLYKLMENFKKEKN